MSQNDESSALERTHAGVGQNKPDGPAENQSLAGSDVGSSDESRASGCRTVLRVVSICFALCLVIQVIFIQTLTFDFVNFDDGVYVYDNDLVKQGITKSNLERAFTGIFASYWHPLTWISHMLDVERFGMRPGGHHLSSVLIHTAAAIALLLALRRATGRLLPSAFAAAAFAVHPLRVESVAWISERKDVLSGFFFALTLLAYAGYARRPSALRYGFVALAFVLGLMSKPMLVTVPFVLLLLDYWPLGRMFPKNGRPSGDPSLGWLLAEKAPLLALAAAASAITVYAQDIAIQGIGQFSLSERVANAAVSYVVYIKQTIWPSGLAFFYPHRHDGLPIWQVIGAFAALIGTTAFAFAVRRRQPYLLVGWLWFVGMLIPVIGLVQVGTQARADRFTYLPQIGLIIAITWWAADLTDKWKYQGPILSAIGIGLLVLLAWCSKRQTQHWRDSMALFSHAVECTTGNADAYKDIGAIWEDRGQYREAADNFRMALAIRPRFPKALSGYGYALYRLGRYDEAAVYLRQCLELDPSYLAASRTLGKALYHLNQLDESDALLKHALERDSRDAETYDYLGRIRSRRGQWAEAVALQRNEISLDPGNAGAHARLAIALFKSGRPQESLAEFRVAVQLAPQDVDVLKVAAWVASTSPDPAARSGKEALDWSQRAAQLSKRQDPVVLDGLAAAYAEVQRFPEAVATAQEALVLAQSNGQIAVAGIIRAHLDVFRSAKPLREPPTNLQE